MKASKIYKETLYSLRRGARRITHQGGQWSGKTVNILMALATLAVEENGENAGVTTITSVSFPHLKGGALRDFETFVYPHFKHAIRQYHRTDRAFIFRSGSIIEFKVYENETKARGQKRKRLFVNEANSFDYMVFFQLDSRSEQTVIDYNPSIQFWAHEKIIGQPGNLTFYSDHRHNLYLTESKHREIESYFDKNKPDGGELFKVYSRGITGNVTGVIFPDWEMIDDVDYPDDEEQIFSIDFGYSVDPTALVRHCRIGNNLYVDELLYEVGTPPVSIRNVLLAERYNREVNPLYCEHDPDMMKSLRNLGINAFPARKGQGSVNAGILMLQGMKVKYTSRSRNIHQERSKYVWMVDKEGKTTNIPVDNNNHTFDAIRYGVYSRYLKSA